MPTLSQLVAMPPTNGAVQNTLPVRRNALFSLSRPCHNPCSPSFCVRAPPPQHNRSSASQNLTCSAPGWFDGLSSPNTRLACGVAGASVSANSLTEGSHDHLSVLCPDSAVRSHSSLDSRHSGSWQEGLTQQTTPSPTSDAMTAQTASTTTHYSVLNFYHLVDIADPAEVLAQHRAWLVGRDIRGRIYISAQGINAQCGGEASDAAEYAKWVSQQAPFEGLRYTLWPAPAHTFPKLRLKLKPNLISIAGGMAALPVTDATQRATPVEPAEWKRMIAEAQQGPAPQRPLVLDVRNDYEWDAGHFVGAARPTEEFFAETPVGDTELDVPAPLRDVDPSTPVMMYCTGGIRCDIYSAFLRRRGFNKLYTLEGGVQSYLREQGAEHWNGSLYVFDGRMAIPPGVTEDADPQATLGDLPAAVPCRLCGSVEATLPHLNCCNIDCNQLFIACPSCKSRFNGCCCAACMSAPRLLRPIKAEGGHYDQWVAYASQSEAGPIMASGRRPEGRLARRARRREASKERRQPFLDERRARKTMVRQAMAKVEQCEQQQWQDLSKLQKEDPEQQTVAAA